MAQNVSRINLEAAVTPGTQPVMLDGGHFQF